MSCASLSETTSLKGMESQTNVSKRVPREFRNWRVQGNPPTLRQPFANPLPTFSANPSPAPPFPWTPDTGLETRISGFLARRNGAATTVGPKLIALHHKFQN